MKQICTILFLLFVSVPANAQEILGTITDSRHEPLIGVTVQVKQSGIFKGSTVTDFDGNYSIKPLDTGYYDVTFSFSGFVTNTVMQIPVNAGKKVTVNVTLANTNNTTQKATQNIYKSPPINRYTPAKSLTAEEIRTYPRPPVTDIADTASRIYTRQRVAPTYIIDGVKTEPIHLNWRKRFANRIHNIFHRNKKLQ